MKRTRNTVQRRAVLDSLLALPGHPTAADVFGHVRESYPNLSLATVYRALHALVEQGAVLEMRVENVSRYDGGQTPHHHVVCRACGAVADAPAEALPTPVLGNLERASGFVLDRHPVQFTGICPQCVEPAARE
uniref:Peroxide stress regulator PerR, FUR family n=1 Tax=uncultured Armatimonadetes bacterium TaxID=157466 RepID=A0A6J4HFC1_9BACT|nr:Peroxide stress regulator PerR, FUR family [uncultured Armatimonadetes bacterium]